LAYYGNGGFTMSVENMDTRKRTFMLKKMYEAKRQEAEQMNSGKHKPY